MLRTAVVSSSIDPELVIQHLYTVRSISIASPHNSNCSSINCKIAMQCVARLRTAPGEIRWEARDAQHGVECWGTMKR